MTVYVSNLSFSVTDELLKGLFTGYGEVTSARVMTDKYTNGSRGFGFVEMPDDTAAQKAIDELNGKMVESRPIAVTQARPKKEY